MLSFPQCLASLPASLFRLFLTHELPVFRLAIPLVALVVVDSRVGVHQTMPCCGGVLPADSGLDAPWGTTPTVTRGAVLSIVGFGIPVFPSSATDLYGRPAMIFFALASPIPGSVYQILWGRCVEIHAEVAAGILGCAIPLPGPPSRKRPNNTNTGQNTLEHVNLGIIPSFLPPSYA